MAQTIHAIDEDGNVQYVLNDTSEFILQSSDSEQFGNLICTDGTQTFFLDGALIADPSDGNGQTYVLQDGDLNHYYIQETDGVFVSEENESSANSLLETVASPSGDEDCSSESQLIQFVDEEGTLINAKIPSTLCLQDETETTGEYQLVEDFQAGFDGAQALQLETNQMVELKQGETSVVQIEGDENRYQYVILEDDNLHIQSYPEFEDQEEIKPVLNDASPAAWENITGRNLITGQQLSLQSLADNPQKMGSLKRKRKKRGGLEELLNKKLNLGRTVDGKKLVGKIIHVGKRKPDYETANEAVMKNVKQKNGKKVTRSPNVANSTEATQTEGTKDDNITDSNSFEGTNVIQALPRKRVSTVSETECIVKRKVICKDILEQISKTLSVLMKLESVSKRLRNKHLLIKVIERKYVQSKETFERKFSYSSGYMVENYIVNQETGDLTESWSYLRDGRIRSEENSDTETPRQVMFEEVLQLSFLITLERKGLHVKVLMEPDGSPFRCDACDKTFRNKRQLNLHLTTLHGISPMKQCEYCPFASATEAEWENHRKYHDGQQVFGCIKAGCEASFPTLEELSVHAEVHKKVDEDISSTCPEECGQDKDVSNHQLENNASFMDEKEANDKDQESKTKIYTCEVCQHTFSRYYNLMRHVLIHIGKDVYRCSICGSAYHYVSSLTRHMVKNHVKI